MMNEEEEEEEESMPWQVADKYDMLGIDDEDATLNDFPMEDMVDNEDVEMIHNAEPEGNRNMNNDISSKALLALRNNGLRKPKD